MSLVIVANAVTSAAGKWAMAWAGVSWSPGVLAASSWAEKAVWGRLFATAKTVTAATATTPK